MRKFIFFILLVTLQAKAADIRLTPDQVSRAGVATTPISKQQREEGMLLPAQVIVPPSQIEVISAPIPAMVASIQVAYGEIVRKGKVLVRLQGGQLLELQRDYVSALAQAQLATEKRRRDETLYADGIIAQNRLSDTRANETLAQALAAEKRATLRLTGADAPTGSSALSGRAEIRAPFDGVVLETAVQPGQRIDEMTALMKIGRLAPLWLEIQASPIQARRLALGDPVTVPGCSNPARVTLIAPHLQTASQSVLIRAELINPQACVKPNQFVQVALSSNKALPAGSWQLPAAAIIRHQDKSWVFVSVQDGYRPVQVDVLEESAAATIVSANLSPDALVVVKGVSTLKAMWLGLGAGESE